jgi:hypothetical protein
MSQYTILSGNLSCGKHSAIGISKRAITKIEEYYNTPGQESALREPRSGASLMNCLLETPIALSIIINVTYK